MNLFDLLKIKKNLKVPLPDGYPKTENKLIIDTTGAEWHSSMGYSTTVSPVDDFVPILKGNKYIVEMNKGTKEVEADQDGTLYAYDQNLEISLDLTDNVDEKTYGLYSTNFYPNGVVKVTAVDALITPISPNLLSGDILTNENDGRPLIYNGALRKCDFKDININKVFRNEYRFYPIFEDKVLTVGSTVSGRERKGEVNIEPFEFKEGATYKLAIDGVAQTATATSNGVLQFTENFNLNDGRIVYKNVRFAPFISTGNGTLFVAVGTSTSSGEYPISLYMEQSIGVLNKTSLPRTAAVPDAAGETPTAAEFNALLAALRDGGIISNE